MNILLIGMQRSGTTLLRRLFTIHPQVRRIFHEHFFLSKFKSSKQINIYLNSMGINAKNIWGEKCPYYPNIRKIPVEEYCRTLHSWYPKELKVIHIVRHPIDIANSTVKKIKNTNIYKPLRIYKKIIPRIVPELLNMKYVMTIKYEHLLTEPDIVIPKIYGFCGLKTNIDYNSQLKKLKNPKYQQIDPTRAFAFMKSKQDLKISFDKVFELLDQIDGPKY